MSKASEIVAIALAEVGYREKASNASLDDKSANAAAGYYNGNKNGYAWCDVFVDWCFFKAYGASEGQRIQCQTGPLGAGCIYSAQYYRQKGHYDNTPKIGDQVFFQTGGEIGHTGIVVEVTSSTIVTVEGNSSNQVKKNTYNRSNSYIAGYGHPLYSDADGTTATPTPTPAPASSLKTCDAKAPLLKKGDTGNVVKNAQALLISKGYACGGRIVQGNEVPDGDFGPTTEKSVRSFQSQKKLDTDGIIGSDTWTALLTT